MRFLDVLGGPLIDQAFNPFRTMLNCLFVAAQSRAYYATFLRSFGNRAVQKW